MAQLKTKKAKQELVVNPVVSMSENPDSISVEMTEGYALITFQMAVGAPETITFTPDGEKEEIEYQEMGGLELDQTMEINGVMGRFRVIKGKKGRADRVVFRPISERKTGRTNRIRL